MHDHTHHRTIVIGGSATQLAPSLGSLGWSAFFEDQICADEKDFTAERISAVHRAHITVLSETGSGQLLLPANAKTSAFAVGDWILLDPKTRMLQRRLERRTVVERHSSENYASQLAAANVDTLFIVTSCNADFNLARLERYLALANQAEITPVILLTKADMVADASHYEVCARKLQRGLMVVSVNPRSEHAILALGPWCGPGQTIALVGSSGVGKSTLVNTIVLTGPEPAQATGGIREHDAKGRHTTTSRSLHSIAGGGWVIDTPGMRSLRVNDIAHGIDTLFAEITELAPLCRFRDCSHEHEPGCAVLDALASGGLDPERLRRWRKLSNESRSKKGSGRQGSVRPTR